MAKRWTWVAWSMLAIYAASLACRAVLAVLNGSITGNATYALYLPVFTAFMVVIGALVVARRPHQPHGLAVLGHRPAVARGLPGR